MAGVVARLGARRTALAAALVLATAAGVGGFALAQDDGCLGNAVAHPEIGACVLPDSLVVEADQEVVEAAIAPYGGQIMLSFFPRTHGVQFPVSSLDELDEIKAELAAQGLVVRYSFLMDPSGGV